MIIKLCFVNGTTQPEQKCVFILASGTIIIHTGLKNSSPKNAITKVQIRY